MIKHTRAGVLAGLWLCALAALPRPAGAQADMAGMVHVPAGPLGISMERMGSGTTWIPDAAPVASANWMVGAWHVMAHGFAWLQYDWQDGPRGDEQLGSLNWAMVMASRDLFGGRVQPRLMLSLDPATVGGSGYPLLLQSGETYQGAPIHDRQHPHDFWMEVGVLYERELTSSVALSLYGAPSGEPALGPVAFMHRPSAIENPFAPLSHHWQDATHISYGVVTAGLFGRRWKVEGSLFNGHEPDEERWGFDAIELNSWSGRVTLNPTAGLSLTAGLGRLGSLEEEEGEEGEEEAHHAMHRATASILYSRAGGDYRWASAAVWGMNRPLEEDHQSTNAVLLETSLTEGRNTLLARAEYVEKSAGELVVPPSSGILPERIFGVGGFALGYLRDLADVSGFTLGVGALATMGLIDQTLEPFYGSRNPRGGVVFLRARPTGTPIMSMPGM